MEIADSKSYAPEVRERAVRMLFEHEHEHTSRWAAVRSIAEKIGCTEQTLARGAGIRSIRHSQLLIRHVL